MRNLCLGLAIAAVVLSTTSHVNAQAANDRTAAQEIAENLKRSGQLKDYRVGVKYEDGVAWLMGTVTSAEQKAIAERLARRSAGVEKVVSNLEIANGQSAPADAGVNLANSPNSQRPAIQPASAVEMQSFAAQRGPRGNMPRPYAPAGQVGVQQAGYGQYSGPQGAAMGPQPLSHVPAGVGRNVSYDNPQLPGYAWPSYAANPNYAALSYPKQYSASAWPYIGPFYPYPQVPLGWRKVTLEWDDGWWFLDFKDCCGCK